jgi:hypothetical protein
MDIRHFKNNSLVCAVSFLTFLLTLPAFAATPKNSEPDKAHRGGAASSAP